MKEEIIAQLVDKFYESGFDVADNSDDTTDNISMSVVVTHGFITIGYGIAYSDKGSMFFAFLHSGKEILDFKEGRYYEEVKLFFLDLFFKTVGFTGF